MNQKTINEIDKIVNEFREYLVEFAKYKYTGRIRVETNMSLGGITDHKVGNDRYLKTP